MPNGLKLQGSCLETCSKVQIYFAELLNTLSTSIDMKVVEPMIDFTKEEIPTTQAIKKKWDGARKDYDSAINKVVMLQKEKKPNPPKIQLAEQEREKLKQTYILRGEEAFCSLLDTNEMSEFATLEKLLTWMETFYQFFRGGYNFLREVHDNTIISHRQWIAEEKGRYEARKKKRPAGEWIPDSISGGSTAKTRMYGIPYEDIIRRDNPATGVPAFLEKAISHLESRGLNVAGIFRISPPKPQLDEIKKTIDSGGDIDWNTLDEHLCTGTIKLFLRELPQPLLTFELYSKFVASVDAEDASAKIKLLKQVVNELPKPNHALIKRLLHLICLIEKRKEENKMTASNLAVVLCPSILYPEVPDPTTMVDDIQKANSVMTLMIESYTEVFGQALSMPKGAAVTFSSNPPTKSHSNPNFKPAAATSPGSGVTIGSKQQSTTGLAATTNTATTTTNNPSGNETPKPAAGETRTGSEKISSHMDASIGSSTTQSTSSASIQSDHSESGDSVTTASSGSTGNISSSSLPSAQSAGNITQSPSLPQIVVPLPGPTDVTGMRQFLKERSVVGPNWDQFLMMQEFADASSQFCHAVMQPHLSIAHVPQINLALKNLAKSIKNVGNSVRDFSSKLPSEMRSKLLLATKDVQDKVLAIPGIFKEFAAGKGVAVGQMIEATKDFAISGYTLTARLKEYTLFDDITVSSDTLSQSLNDLQTSFNQDAVALASAISNVQSSSFRFTAILRSKILDCANQDVILSIADIIELAEADTRELCNEIKSILTNETLGPDLFLVTSTMETRIKSLQSSASKTDALIPQLTVASNSNVKNATLVAPTIEQLATNVATHISNTAPPMKTMVEYMRAVTDIVANMRAKEADASLRNFNYMTNISKVGELLSNISTLVQSIMSKNNDPTVIASLTAYNRSVQFYDIMIKTIASIECFELPYSIDSISRSMTYVKDFVFITFPVLFNIRDASLMASDVTPPTV